VFFVLKTVSRLFQSGCLRLSEWVTTIIQHVGCSNSGDVSRAADGAKCLLSPYSLQTPDIKVACMPGQSAALTISTDIQPRTEFR
jgi:hypothetical protein